MARAADNLSIEERIGRIADIFSTFHNPDKETVLTPWRVVNMHICECLGGWCFLDERFKKSLGSLRFVDCGDVTKDVFSSESIVMEINSKSGLYPLLATYNIYRSRLEIAKKKYSEVGNAFCLQLWDLTLEQNILVVCKTPMARSITRRTLAGFRNTNVHAEYYKDLIENIIKNPDLVVNTFRDGKKYWKINDKRNMTVDAIIGNPPYQVTVAKTETNNDQKRSSSIFQHFQTISDRIARYTALIYPGSRWIHRSGKGMEQFGLQQINTPHLSKMHFFPDSTDVFEDVGIADGLTIVFKDMKKKSKGFQYIYSKGEITYKIKAKNPGKDLMPLNPMDSNIADKFKKVVLMKFAFLHDSILSQKLFSIESDFVENNPSLVRKYTEEEKLADDEIKLFTTDKAGKSGRATWYVANRDIIKTGKEYLNRWKVVVSSANAGGQKRSNQMTIMDNHSAFGRSRVALKTFKSEREAQNFFRYCNSELIRYAFLLTDETLTSVAKLVPDILDYKDSNGVLDFNSYLDPQLYTLFGIGKKEQEYIRNTLAEKRR
ncbi:MAG: Eco57I restriction-modification methylase domain-containing protein [Prevotella sp.]|nr:Eco57I restriction-modification methylase domain-containing protein [Prevotella sp.]